jgi:hypothetical protein
MMWQCVIPLEDVSTPVSRLRARVSLAPSREGV